LIHGNQNFLEGAWNSVLFRRAFAALIQWPFCLGDGWLVVRGTADLFAVSPAFSHQGSCSWDF
jgi:hypothetical protein